MEPISIVPQGLDFQDVRQNQAYSQTMTITNELNTAVALRIRPQNVDRFKVEPANVTIGAGERRDVSVTLRLVKPLARKKGGGPHKDTFHIKSDFFERNYNVLFTPLGTGDKENEGPAPPPRPTGRPPALPTASAERARSASQAPAPRARAPQPHRSSSLTRLPEQRRASSGDAGFDAAAQVRREFEALLAQQRAEQADEQRAGALRMEGLRVRLERMAAEAEEWRRVAGEGEQHRRRAHELGAQVREWDPPVLIGHVPSFLPY